MLYNYGLFVRVICVPLVLSPTQLSPLTSDIYKYTVREVTVWSLPGGVKAKMVLLVLLNNKT